MIDPKPHPLSDDFVSFSPVDTKSTPGPFDGFEGAKPDEPIFTLQGGDPLAPELVLVWARKAREMAFALEESAPARAAELLLRATSAEQVAWAMQAYQKGHQQQPDQHDAYEKAHSKSDVTGADNPEALQKLVIHRKLRWCLERLGNSEAEVVEVADMLASLGCTAKVGRLRLVADSLRSVASTLLPQRKFRRES